MSTRTATTHRTSTLAVLSVAQFLIALDYSILYVALPSIAADLGLDPATAQWIVSAYAVPFAGFLVVGGRLTDRIGARRMFVIALVAFGIASAIGGAATGGAVLLAARGTQGLAAALLQPAVLALIGTSFPAGPARARAVAVWGSVGASGLAAGAILGGLLTTASWRLTFAVNVPLTLACALVAILRVPPAQPEATSRIPVLASVLGTGAALTIVINLTTHRWTWAGLAAVLLGAFVYNERRSASVLITRSLRRIRSLHTGAAATALYMASVGSEFYLLTLLLQRMKGYGPLEAGLAFLPLAALITAGNVAADRLIRRYGPTTALAAGFAIATAGLLWLSLTLSGDSYVVDLLPGILLSGFGHGAIYTAMFTIGTHDVPAADQGTAGALLTTSQYLAGAVAIAILTLALGAVPGYAEFRAAFLLTTLAAGGGLVLAVVRRR